MIPGPICYHFEPRLRERCAAGLRAPHDCEGCPAYLDGTREVGLTDHDQTRIDGWAAAHRGDLRTTGAAQRAR